MTTLAAAARDFARRPTPRLLAGAVVAGAALRLGLGPVRLTDLVVVATVAAAQPFVEWLIHVHVLHAKPVTVAGRRVDVGYSHRVHHDDPRDPAHVFVDVRFLLALLAGTALLWARAYAAARPLLGTLLVVLPAGGLAYEWTHFLIHTDYRPRTRLYHAAWRAHRLHHFRNDAYWMGVTTPLPDLVLRTAPPPGSVPVRHVMADPRRAPRPEPAVRP